MKKIITTVGTSIFSNYYEWKSEKKESGEAKADFNTLRKKPHDDWGFYVDEEINKLRKVISKWATSNNQASAEISSLLKIAEQYPGEDLEVYLIATDTVLSRLAAELVQEWFGDRMRIMFDPARHVIQGLSVEKSGAFVEHGIQNLVSAILEIGGTPEGREHEVMLNISGGYKGIIPVMTIVGQLYDMAICYTYEDSDELIEIARMPLSFDWEVMEKYVLFLKRPQEIEGETADEMKTLHLVKKEDDGYKLTILGTLISDFLVRKPPFFETPFGYFVEYKLKECFDGEYQCQNVIHGYKPQKIDKNAPDGDVDLMILDDGFFTGIEIKPFSLLQEPSKLFGFMEKLVNRSLSAGEQKQLSIKELWLITYSFKSLNDPPQPVLTEEQKALLTFISSEMKKHIPEIQFLVKHFFVKPNKVDGKNYRMQYHEFVGSTLKAKDVKTIFTS